MLVSLACKSWNMRETIVKYCIFNKINLEYQMTQSPSVNIRRLLSVVTWLCFWYYHSGNSSSGSVSVEKTISHAVLAHCFNPSSRRVEAWQKRARQRKTIKGRRSYKFSHSVWAVRQDENLSKIVLSWLAWELARWELSLDCFLSLKT